MFHNSISSPSSKSSEAMVSRHLRITNLVDSHIAESVDGCLCSVIKLAGYYCETLNESEINDKKRAWRAFLNRLNDEFMVLCQIHRRKMSVELTGEFTTSIAIEANEIYHSKFKNAAMYTNDLYIAIIHKGFDSGKLGKVIKLFKSTTQKFVRNERERYRQTSLEKLSNVLDEAKKFLSGFSPRILGLNDTEAGFSELLAFFAAIPNCLQNRRYRYTETYPVEVNGLKPFTKEKKLYPRGNLATFLPGHHIHFGKSIQFSDSNGNHRFAQMIGMKDFPPFTNPVMMAKMLKMNSEFVYTTVFIPEPLDISEKKVKGQQRRMSQTDDAAVSQQIQLDELADQLASGNTKMGANHNYLMIIGDDLKILKNGVDEAIKFLGEKGFVGVVETINKKTAFFSTIPFNHNSLTRTRLIQIDAFADLFPMNNYPVGYRDSNHLGAAVTLLETPAATPMFFNFHTKGSGDKMDLTPGHTTIIGGNGSGKTVFMGFMDSQMERYGGRSYFFDRDRGLDIYVRACGGVYSVLSADYPQDSSFNPFALSDTATNRSFLKQWLEILVRKEGEQDLPPNIQKEISEMVTYAYDHLPVSKRYLSEIVKYLPSDFERKDSFRQFLRADSIERFSDGDFAYLFDNTEDHLNVEVSRLGFDFTEIMKHKGKVSTLTNMYIFHRIESANDGQRTSIWMDEGWQILSDPYWKSRMKEWLPTLRKRNIHIILATQSPSSILESDISAQFLDNCATNIFFVNPKADFEKVYRHFNITEAEFDFIKHNLPQKREFLYKQGHESRICKLNLSGMEDILALYSGNKETVQMCEEVRRLAGNNPKDWIPLFHEMRRGAENRQRTLHHVV